MTIFNFKPQYLLSGQKKSFIYYLCCPCLVSVLDRLALCRNEMTEIVLCWFRGPRVTAKIRMSVVPGIPITKMSLVAEQQERWADLLGPADELSTSLLTEGVYSSRTCLQTVWISFQLPSSSHQECSMDKWKQHALSARDSRSPAALLFS